MKRFALILILSIVPFLAVAGGIYSAEDLVAFAKAVNQYQPTDNWRNEDGVVCLEADIDMSKIKKFQPIFSFGGVFDGKGHSIKNWRAKSGLFGTLLDGGEVRNLIIDESCSIKAANQDEEYAVGFVADVNKGIIANCQNYGSVTHKSTYTSNDVFVGGLVGKNIAVVFDCRNFGDVCSNSVSTLRRVM